MTATLIVILLLMISVVMNVLLLQKVFSRKDKTDKRIAVRSTILEGIQSVAQLATLRRNFQSVVKFSESSKIPFTDIDMPGTARKFMLQYNGTIVCGCDLTKAHVDVSDDGGKVNITLPESEILDAYSDVNSYEVYDQSTGIFASSLKFDEQNKEIQADLETVKKQELENGILAQSDEHVKKILAGTLNALPGMSGVQVAIAFNATETPQLEAKNTSSND